MICNLWISLRSAIFLFGSATFGSHCGGARRPPARTARPPGREKFLCHDILWKTEPIGNSPEGIPIYILASFEGVCLTTVILAPGASARGCELRAMRHFRRANHGSGGQTTGKPQSSARPFFMHRHRKRSKYQRKRTYIFEPKSPQASLGNPRCPKGAHRHPKGANGSSK